MNIGMIRALILVANVCLMGLIGYAVYEGWWDRDEADWAVKEPDWPRTQLPEISQDARDKEQASYKVIHNAFDPPPPPPPAPVTVKPPEPVKADPSSIDILAIQYAEGHPELSSALLTGKLADRDATTGQPAQHFFGPGVDFGAENLGMKAYAGCKIKSISEAEVVITGKDGKDYSRPGPKQTAEKGKP